MSPREARRLGERASEGSRTHARYSWAGWRRCRCGDGTDFRGMLADTGGQRNRADTDFRAALYDRYVSTFKGLNAEPSFAWWDHKYLPLLDDLDRAAPILEIGCGDGGCLRTSSGVDSRTPPASTSLANRSSWLGGAGCALRLATCSSTSRGQRRPLRRFWPSTCSNTFRATSSCAWRHCCTPRCSLADACSSRPPMALACSPRR